MYALTMMEIKNVSGGNANGTTKKYKDHPPTQSASSRNGVWDQVGNVLADDTIIGAGIVGTVLGGGPVTGAATVASAYKMRNNETPLERTMNSALVDPIGTAINMGASAIK